jgi:DNA-binding CsgD family transcriptional regulator
LTATLAGTIEPGREQLKAARALHHELGVRIGEARSTAVLGLGYALQGDLARGQEFVEEALSTYVAEDDPWGQGHAHLYLGIIADLTTADSGVTTSHYRKAVECLRPLRDATLLPMALVGQAGSVARGEPARALKVVAAASAMRARVGGQFAPVFRERAARVRAEAEAALGTDAERVWSEGERLGTDEAIALAFGTKTPRAASVGGLSAREQAVARLVADGLSNKRIATQLQLSVRTVESHVRHALTKVGFTNRTQLATWARERIQ